MKEPTVIASLPADTAQKLRRWIEECQAPIDRIDAWFSNFPDPQDQNLAAKLLSNFTYISEPKFRSGLDRLGNKLRNQMQNNGENLDDALFIYDSSVLDSSHPILYSASKSEYWPIVQENTFGVEKATSANVGERPIVVLNDTQGSGSQFARTLWPRLSECLKGGQKVYAACMVSTEIAMERFQALSKDMIEIASIYSTGISLPQLIENRTFTREEAARIRELSQRSNGKFPLGFGDCQLLVAYHYQCPNNTLPIFWGRGRTPGNWINLFDYKSKRSISAQPPSTSKAGVGLREKKGRNNRASVDDPVSPQKTKKTGRTVRLLLDADDRYSDLDKLDELFEGLVTRDAHLVEKPISTILKSIAEVQAGGEPVRLVGPRGSGKMMIITALVFHLGRMGLKPLFLDFSRHRIEDISAGITQALPASRHKRGEFVSILYEPYGVRAFTPRQAIEKITDLRSLVATPTEEPNAGAFKIGHFFHQNITAATKYLQLASLKKSGQYINAERASHYSSNLVSICNQHRCSPDLFLAIQYLESLNAGKNPNSVSDLVERYVRGTLGAQRQGDILGEISRLARYAYENFTISTEDFAKPRLENLQNLSSRSSHVENWLVAYGSLVKLKDAWTNSSRNKDKSMKDLDFVHPNSVNSFIRSIISDSAFDIDAKFWSWLRDLIRDMNQNEILLKANVCYVIGRSANKAREPEAIQSLKTTMNQMTEFLRAVSCARYIAINFEKFDRISREAARSFLARFAVRTGTNSRDILSELGRIESHALLCQRSAIISMAMLSDKEAAHSYVRRLMSSVREDDLNRGFHLVYYGDLPYRKSDPLIATDQHGVNCTLTVNSLIKAIGGLKSRGDLVSIEVHTLLSLIRNRNCCSQNFDLNLRSSVPTELVEEALSVSEAFIKKTPDLPRDISSGMELMINQIRWGDFVVEAAIDDMYSMKELYRTGWRQVIPQEPIPAHAYFVRVLAGILGIDSEVSATVTESRSSEMALYHDIGESIIGDVPHDQKVSKDLENERSAVSVISSLGSLTGSSEALRIRSLFDEFEGQSGSSQAAKFAKDMDRLDLLIQLFRYKRMGAMIPREESFLEHIKPGNFETQIGRFWAVRFGKYFVSSASQKTERSLWPVSPSDAKKMQNYYMGNGTNF